jgi:hypothetical protein
VRPTLNEERESAVPAESPYLGTDQRGLADDTTVIGVKRNGIARAYPIPLLVAQEIVSEVIDEVFHLKNSVAKHRPEEEFAAIRQRIARTTKRIEKTAWQLDQYGSKKAARYLRRWLPSIVTFAERAIEGFEVPND